jgi:hypothetical protein
VQAEMLYPLVLSHDSHALNVPLCVIMLYPLV